MDRPIGALWIKTSAKGNKYLSGTITLNGQQVYINVVKNIGKLTKENANPKWPDWNIYLSTRKEY